MDLFSFVVLKYLCECQQYMWYFQPIFLTIFLYQSLSFFGFWKRVLNFYKWKIIHMFLYNMQDSYEMVTNSSYGVLRAPEDLRHGLPTF